jgi:uncharacterized phage protein (TIGR02220 family)
MRWFKHLTDSHDDEKLVSLRTKHGLEGYGFWWLLIEIVAKQTGKTDDKFSVAYPVSHWLRLTGVYHHKKFRELTEMLQRLCLIDAQSIDNVGTISELSLKDVLTISIPNLLKYRDEYARKSVQTPDRLPKISHLDIELETEADKTIVGQPDITPYSEVVEFLNAELKTQYSVKTQAIRKLIHARCQEGHTLEDFKKVITNMKKTWSNDSKMKQYLRPHTLFNGKFSSYLNTQPVQQSLLIPGSREYMLRQGGIYS